MTSHGKCHISLAYNDMELNYVGVSQENGKAKTFANEYLDKTLFNLFSIKYI